MLACVYQSRPLQSSAQHQKKSKKPSTLVIDRVPGFALKMVTSSSTPISAALQTVTEPNKNVSCSTTNAEDEEEEVNENKSGNDKASVDKRPVVKVINV